MFDWATTLVGLTYVPAVLLKTTVLLACSWCAHGILRRHNPRWRVLLWRATLVALAILPVVEWVLPRLDVAIMEDPALAPIHLQPTAVSPAPTAEPIAPAVIPTPVMRPSRIEIAPPSRNLLTWIRVHMTAFMGVAWAGVSLWLFAGIAHARRNIRTLIVRSLAAPPDVRSVAEQIAQDLGVKRPVEIRVVPGLGSPFLTGVHRPVIALSARYLEETDSVQLRAVLAHELAHLKSGDPFWMAFARVAGATLWFHPLIWRMRSVHNGVCEDVCDGVATNYLGGPETYSVALAREALALLDARPVPGGIAMIRSAEIVRRLRKIQRGIRTTPLARHWVATSLIVGVVLLLTLGSLRLVHAQPEITASGFSSTAPNELPDQTLLKWVKFDAAECVASRDRLGSPDIYLIAKQEDRLPLWREAAKRGMPEGQVLLAMCHAFGTGVEANQLEKCRLLRAAVEQGDPAAMYCYAAALFHGDGVTQDVAGATALYTKAANEGDRAAMWQLASLYGNGTAVEPNHNKALDWLEASATAGAPYAMFQLGQAYFSGNLGLRDEMEGRKWIAFAADLGCPFGVDRLRQLSGHAPYIYPPEFVPPSDVASSPLGSPTESPQIPAVDPAATREVPSPTSLSDTDLLAEVTADELACRVCRDRAGYSKVYIQLHASQRLPLWQEAANRGMAAGQVMVGLCYTAMIGFERNDDKRTELFRAAAEQGDPTGMHNYASSLQGGIGVESDPQEAFNWWKKAAELGEPAGMWHLAWCYQYGQHVEQDNDAALDWYLRAADAGSGEAMYQLGMAFMGGHDMVPTDVAEGRRWLARAAEGGFPKAVVHLREAIQSTPQDGVLVGSRGNFMVPKL